MKIEVREIGYLLMMSRWVISNPYHCAPKAWADIKRSSHSCRTKRGLHFPILVTKSGLVCKEQVIPSPVFSACHLILIIIQYNTPPSKKQQQPTTHNKYVFCSWCSWGVQTSRDPTDLIQITSPLSGLCRTSMSSTTSRTGSDTLCFQSLTILNWLL